MKKLTACLLAVLLMISACLPAIAAGDFNLSSFESNPNYKVSVDEEDSRRTYIEPADCSPFFFDPMISEDYYCSYVPDIYILLNTPVFRIWCYFFADREYVFETSEITVNGHKYTVEDVTGYTEQYDNGDILDASVCVFGTNLSAMIEDMRADANAKIRMIGQNGEYEFELTETMSEAIVGMYDDFVAANGPTPAANMFESAFTVEDVPVSGGGGRLSPSNLIGRINGRTQPGSFNTSVFGSDYTISDADASGHRAIDLTDFSNSFFDPGYSDTYYSVFGPDIALWSDGTVSFRLWSFFFVDIPYNVHTFEFAFPDATYTIEGVSQSISEEENGDKFEYLSAEIGDECSVIIDALRSTLDTNVTLTLRGDTGYYAFSMKRPMREAIIRTWDLFIEAGGESHLTEADEPDFSIR